MIMLAAAIREHWHAVELDLLHLGYTADDIGGRLTLCQLISVVVAAPPNSSLGSLRWSRSDELLANLGEQQAGLVDLNARYARPEVDSVPNSRPRTEYDNLPPYKGIQLDSIPVDEFTAKLKARQEEARRQNMVDET
jgi:hypothetical protein